MKTLKIGQEIIVTEDFEVGCLGGTKKVKKGDKAFVTSGGNARYITGKARGKTQILSSVEVKDYDVENITKILCSRLDAWFGLDEILQEHDIDMSDVKDTLEDVLLEIFDF